MSLKSRSSHINTRHLHETAASLNAIFNAELFTDCPYPGCLTKHLLKGLNTHITKKHPGHLIPLNPPPNINAAVPSPPAQPAALPLLPQAPPLPHHPPPLPHIPPDFIAAIGAVIGDAMHLEAVAQNEAVPAAPQLPVAQPAPAVAPPPVPIPPVPLSNLVARFRLGLYKFHPSWKEPLLSLFVEFLDGAQSEDIETSTTSIAALQLLPGLLEFSRRRRKATLSPINVLRTILACPNKASETVRLASTWFRVFSIRPLAERNPPTHEDLRARIESCLHRTIGYLYIISCCQGRHPPQQTPCWCTSAPRHQ